MNLKPKTLINGRYEVVKPLGQGGMGQVFLVQDRKRENSFLALKVLLNNQFQNETLSYFRKEFEILANIHHPHICQVYDFSAETSKSIYFYTSEYIEGTDIIKASQIISFKERLKLAIQLSRALSFIHNKGIVHRDVKPSNILVTKDQNSVKLLDFGIAEIVGNQQIKSKASGISLSKLFLGGCKPFKWSSNILSLFSPAKGEVSKKIFQKIRPRAYKSAR